MIDHWSLVISMIDNKNPADSVILLPAHLASFAHKFLFQRVPARLGCNGIADLSLKIVFRTHKFAVGTH